MPNKLYLVTILMLAAGQVAMGQNSQPHASKPSIWSKSKFKSVEFGGKYIIQVPVDFTLRKVFEKGRSGPTFYVFEASPPRNESIQGWLLPYRHIAGVDDETGKVTLPMPFDDATLRGSFTTSQGQDVYYGWSVIDYSNECTMNSPCPVPRPQRFRYVTQYIFVIFDKRNDAIVEFRTSVFGPTEKVTTLRGDARWLRQAIIATLTSIH